MNNIKHILRIRIWCIILILLFGPGTATASQLPVFRYALEHWDQDTYEVVVLHRAALTDEENAVVQWLRRNSREQRPYAPYTVSLYDVDSEDISGMSSWRGTFDRDMLPSMILLGPETTSGAEPRRVIYQSDLTIESAQTLLDSPVRKELAERLLGGDSAVWVLIQSGYALQDSAALEELNAGLDEINRLYTGGTASGGRAHPGSEMPVSFSSLTIARDNALEIITINIIFQQSAEMLDLSEPVIVPVFGRGRALGAYRADSLDVAKIREISSYLIGPCEEEAKLRHPGYDLLMISDWDAGISRSWYVMQEPLSLPDAEENAMTLKGFLRSRFLIIAGVLFMLAVLAISLAMNVRMMVSRIHSECKSCHKKGYFAFLNKQGLCRKCAPDIESEMDAITETIQHSIEFLNKTASNTEAQKICTAILKEAKRAEKFENMGVRFSAIRPAELIKTYSEKLDTLKMESDPVKLKHALNSAHTALQPYDSISNLAEAMHAIEAVKELLGRTGSLTRKIAFINQKGGVGKTTSTISIGAGLAKLGKRVLLIDFDPQANLTDGLGVEEEKLEYSVYDFMNGKVAPDQVIIQKDGLSIIPSHTMLTKVEQECGDKPQCNHLLRNALQGLDEFDYILIDCPPTFGFLTLNALNAANEIYIPFLPEYFALKGIKKTMDMIEFIKKTDNEYLSMQGLIATRYDGRKSLHREVVEKIQQSFGSTLYSIVHEDIPLSEASSFGQSIFDYQPESSGAKDYMELCQKIDHMKARKSLPVTP